MSANDEISLLIGRIEKSEAILKKITYQYDQFLETDFKMMGRKNTSAIVIAEFLVDYYTCLETLFLRISQFFENSLQTERWHADLLEKMTLRIEGLREPVISDQTYGQLRELMRFRHFRRYYFELEYDWDKLDFLVKKFTFLRGTIGKELSLFKDFLSQLKQG